MVRSLRSYSPGAVDARATHSRAVSSNHYGGEAGDEPRIADDRSIDDDDSLVDVGGADRGGTPTLAKTLFPPALVALGTRRRSSSSGTTRRRGGMVTTSLTKMTTLGVAIGLSMGAGAWVMGGGGPAGGGFSGVVSAGGGFSGDSSQAGFSGDFRLLTEHGGSNFFSSLSARMLGGGKDVGFFWSALSGI